MKLSPLMFAGLIIILVVVFYFSVPIAENLSKIDPIYVFYSFVILVLVITMKQIKWHILLNQTTKSRFKLSIATYFPGQLINEIAPTGTGDLAKAYLIKQHIKITGGSAIAVPYIERAIDILILSSIAILSVLFMFSASISVYTGILAVVIIFLSVIFLLIATIPKRIADVLTKVIDFVTKPDIKILRKIGYKAGRFIVILAGDFGAAVGLYKNRKKILALSIIISIIDWILEGFGMLLLLKAVGFDIPLLPSVGIVAVSWIVGIASMFPGGLGVREIVLSVLYSMYSIPFSSAFLATIIYRFIIFVCFSTGSVASLWIVVGLKNRNKKAELESMLEYGSKK